MELIFTELIFTYLVVYLIFRFSVLAIVGSSQRRLLAILARDAGAVGMTALIAFMASKAGLHEEVHPLIFHMACYALTISVLSFIGLSVMNKRNKSTS
ncbi:hypothetical protein BK026_13670 [Alteromonas sp. V450]|nr:hypothetical protein BK026_13670 [Alteromonas sp. V450]